MKLKRILSLFLAVCILATTITIQVAPVTVKAYENIIVSDNFNGAALDMSLWSQPAASTISGSIKLEEFPSAQNKSLGLIKSDNSKRNVAFYASIKPFTGTTINQGELATIKAKIANKNPRGGAKVEIFSDATTPVALAKVVMGKNAATIADNVSANPLNDYPLGISVSNGSGGYINLLPTYTTGQFYSLEFRIDISTNKFDLYLDNNLVAQSVTLNKPTTNLGKVVFDLDAQGSSSDTVNRGFFIDDFSAGILVSDPIIPYIEPTAQKDPLSTREMIYENDFSNTSFDNRIVVNNSGGQCEISDGTLNVTRTGASADATSTKIYFDENKGKATDFLKFGYTLSRTSTNEVQQALSSSIGKILLLNWLTDGTMKISYNDTGALAVSTIPSYVYSDKVDVMMYINPYDSKFSLWLDGKLILDDKYSYVPNIKDIVYLETYLEGTNYTTAKLDNVIIGYSYPENSQVAKYDENLLTIDSLLTKPFLRDNLIDADLNMSTTGKYGSNITWESSNPFVIATDGKVTRPVDLDYDTEVKLKATISAYEQIITKEFTFTVYPYFTNGAASSGYAKHMFDFNTILTEPANAITLSLDLPFIGCTNLPITWSANQNTVIANSGKVTRPRWDQYDAKVVLTADFGNGATQDYNVTVLADKVWTDPMYSEYTRTDLTSDEEFFGKWDSAKGEWVLVDKEGDIHYGDGTIGDPRTPDVPTGRFDYTKPGLEKIEAAVKAGDYYLAKVELLEYMRNRENPPAYEPIGRNAEQAKAAVAGIYSGQGDKYIQGFGVFNPFETKTDGYQLLTIPIKVSNIAKGGATTFSISSLYNENSAILLASNQYPDANMRPKLEIKVNGQTKYYNVDADAMVRAGQYIKQNYGMESEMKVKMFGDLLGDETYKAVLRFALDDLTEFDVISDPRLLVYAKGADGFMGSKDLFIGFEPTNTWNESDIVYNSLDNCLFNWNGIPGGCDWSPNLLNSNNVYDQQTSRFYEIGALGAEYAYTNDETYAYESLTRMMDWINDVGGPMDFVVSYDPTYDTRYGTSSAGAATGTKVLYAQYTGTVNMVYKNLYWNVALQNLIKSKYMTPEIYTAILKSQYSTMDGFIYSTYQVNGRPAVMMAMLQSSLYYPEFYLHTFYNPFPSPYAYGSSGIDPASVTNNTYNRITYANDQMAVYMQNMYMNDGVYKAPSELYSSSTYARMIAYKKILQDCGLSAGETLDKYMINAGYYNSLLRAPDGTNLAFGDAGNGKDTGARFPELYDWYGDRELQYIGSLGKVGTKPSKTSIQFPTGAVTFMRADWTQRSPFAFINASGAGTSNGHVDDNAMTVYAYGRMLLTDQGIFSYGADTYSSWGNSIKAHNTVVIDGKTAKDSTIGKVDNWVSSNMSDFLSQSATTYSSSYGDHKRTVTFIKPRFWIVSDLMTPTDKTKSNTYKQLWHMLPTSNISINTDDGIIRSNFQFGANIILASPDAQKGANAGTSVKIEDGADGAEDGEYALYDYGYQQLSPAPYGYVEKTATGTTSIDTVLMPTEDKNATIKTERINIGVTGDVASAMKFETTVDNIYSMNYYLLDYKNSLTAMRAFDIYKSNGKSTLITEDKTGKWNEIHLVNGNKVTKTDKTTSIETTLVDIGTNNDMSFEIKGNMLFVDTSSATPDFSQVTLYTTDKIDKVVYNNTGLGFAKDGDIITLTNTATKIQIVQSALVKYEDDNTDVTALKDGGKIIANATVISSMGTTAKVLAVLYDENNIVRDIQSTSLIFTADDSLTSSNLTTQLPANATGYKYKLFVLDSMGTLKPIPFSSGLTYLNSGIIK